MGSGESYCYMLLCYYVTFLHTFFQSILEKIMLVGSLTHANIDGYRFACISHIIQNQSLKEPTTQE